MATAAWLGIGSLLQMADSGGTVFTTIAECKSLKGPSRKRAIVDVTNHNSLNQTREYINGLIDPGSMQFEANYLPADPSQDANTGFASVFNSGVRRNFRILLSNPNNNTLSFQGLAISHDVSIPIDKEASFSGEVKITGPVTVT